MKKVILHAGCGPESLPEWLNGREVRLDIDERWKPDIVSSLTEIPVEDLSFDGVYCCHTLEHLHPYDGLKALREFRRVLRVGGAALIVVPDLEDVKPTRDVVYESAAGPVSGLDMIYGMAKYTAENPFMAHRNGFVQGTLEELLKVTGFKQVQVVRQSGYNLLGVGLR